jgi:nicotinate-nucleotide pyrophosphorylase (carboxylating)
LSPPQPLWDNRRAMIEPETLRRAVRLALEEDAAADDITSAIVIDQAARASGAFVAREELTACGLEVAREVFRQADPALAFETRHADGDRCAPGEVLAVVRGRARPILAGERTALNFMQRLSGIATATSRLVALVRGTGVQIADTRKTVPGLRAFDKYAVATGGGTNHRAGLADAILIKDNHWRLAGGVAEAVRRARAAGRPAAGAPITIEVTTAGEARAAIEAGAEALLLDNMDDATLEETLAVARGRAFLEVSGGLTADRAPRLATLGIQRLSIGALTHSVRAVDIALEMEAA